LAPAKSNALLAPLAWREPNGAAIHRGEREMRSPFSCLGLLEATMPTALITGVAGQDGSYLAEFLVGRGYHVLGTTRDVRRALGQPFAIALAGVDLVEAGPATGPETVSDLVRRNKPDEVYHLGGPSSVSASWADPAGTERGIVLSTALLLDAVVDLLPSPRLFVAGSCEIFAPADAALDESAALGPQSPYARAKLDALELVRSAREKHGIYATTGILFNHESARRGPGFVTRKIAVAAARIARGQQAGLRLGNIDVQRDWGFAGDFVRAMWLMQFQEEPEDLVLGTGIAHSVTQFCDAAFSRVGLRWQDHVTVDPSLLRRSDAPLRLANPARAKARLGWTPEVDFQRLVEMMVDFEMREGR
jgi:GDPmannose 4,6-dehydratase